MRYRALTADGDSTFCSGSTAFLVNIPATVAQAVLTRLRLLAGEWFLDFIEGTPYGSEVVGKGTTNTYDAAIQQRILETQGVIEITSYQSTLDGPIRKLNITATVKSVYGVVPINASLPL